MPDALDHITIQGFKSIASLEIELKPINVLIGANGLARIQRECPHFADWLKRLEALRG